MIGGKYYHFDWNIEVTYTGMRDGRHHFSRGNLGTLSTSSRVEVIGKAVIANATRMTETAEVNR